MTLKNTVAFAFSLVSILRTLLVCQVSSEGHESVPSSASSTSVSSSSSSPSPSTSSSPFIQEETATEPSTQCFRQQCYERGGPVLCKCDRKCISFGDCCYGARIPPPHIIPLLQFDTSIWECIQDSFLPAFYPELNHGYRIVTRCPSEWPDEDVRSECETASENAIEDVLFIHEEDYYRSVACAMCNSINETTLFPVYGSEQCTWRSKNELECFIYPNSTPPVSDYDTDNTTTIALYQDIPTPRLCLSGVQESCPIDAFTESDTLQKMCHVFYVPLIFNQSVHKNPFCAECNNNELDMHCNIIIPVTRTGTDFFRVGIGAVFSGIVNRGQEEESKAAMTYGEDIAVSSPWPVCKSVQTHLIYENGNIKCFRNETCAITSNSSIANARIAPASFSFEQSISDALVSGLDIADIPSLITLLQVLGNRSKLHLPEYLNIKQWCHYEKYDIDPLGKTDCSNELYVGQPVEFNPFVMFNESFIFFNGSFIKPIWWRNTTDLSFDEINWIRHHQMYLCGIAQEVRFCSSITVTEDAVEWLIYLNETVLKYKDRVYFPDEFFVHPDGRILLCVDDDSNESSYMALNFLGNVAFGLSSACLLGTLLTYLMFSELRNRQGIVVINFLVALLFGQILLQYVGHRFSHWTIPCLTAASLSHFFFLSSFVWTTVLAWDLRRSLSGSSMKVVSKMGRSDCKIALYALVGWGIPLVIASVTLLLQLGGFNNAPILEYGGPACWFATRLSSLAVFFGPICVCLLVNCFLFFSTIRDLHITNKATAMVRKSPNASRDQLISELRIFVKISALLGFAWLFGFLAMIVNILVTWYLFVIVSGLQGVFIFFSFGANNRVRKLWRSLLGNTFQWNSSTQSQTRHESSTQQ